MEIRGDFVAWIMDNGEWIMNGQWINDKI